MMKLRLLVVIFLSSFIYAQPSAVEIIEKVTDIMSPENTLTRGTQTIITSSGKERTFEFDSWSAGKGEKSLLKYTRPAAIRGQAFLTLNNADDIWTYFPRTKRVRKLASHAKKQKVQGSDFTYEDMGGGDTFTKKFTSTLLGEEEKQGEMCWKLEMVGIASEDPPYPKMILWARKSDFCPVAVDYYNEKDFNSKSLLLNNIQVVEGIPTPMEMIMTDNKERSQTVMRTLEVTYAWTPPDNFFSERTLKK